jgi:hypothetical protein
MNNVKHFTDLYKEGKLSEATLIKMAAFKDELVKTSFMSSGVKNFLTYLGAGMGLTTGAAVMAGGIHAITNAIEEHKTEGEKEPAFKSMLRQHPDLKEQENLAWMYFESLYHFSPIIATDPLTAGAYIRSAIRMHDTSGGPLPDVVQRLVDVQQKHRDALQKTETPWSTVSGGFKGQSPLKMPGMNDMGLGIS